MTPDRDVYRQLHSFVLTCSASNLYDLDARSMSSIPTECTRLNYKTPDISSICSERLLLTRHMLQFML